MALIPSSVAEVQSLSRLMSRSMLVPQALRGKESDVAVTIMAGLELGIPPMTALRLIHVVQGRPVLAADLLVACVRRLPDCESFKRVESTAKKAVYTTKRKGEDPVTQEWTLEDAKRAGLLNKDNWKKYPAAMLRARAKADLARDVYPDAVAGVYIADEAADIDESAPVDPCEDVPEGEVIDAEVVEDEPTSNGNRRKRTPQDALKAIKSTLEKCYGDDLRSKCDALEYAWGTRSWEDVCSLHAQELWGGLDLVRQYISDKPPPPDTPNKE
jgi:hypothetical protein